jgi:hypothetical protein
MHTPKKKKPSLSPHMRPHTQKNTHQAYHSPSHGRQFLLVSVSYFHRHTLVFFSFVPRGCPRGGEQVPAVRIPRSGPSDAGRQRQWPACVLCVCTSHIRTHKHSTHIYAKYNHNGLRAFCVCVLRIYAHTNIAHIYIYIYIYIYVYIYYILRQLLRILLSSCYQLRIYAHKNIIYIYVCVCVCVCTIYRGSCAVLRPPLAMSFAYTHTKT